MSKLLYNSLLITVPIVLVNMIHINIIGFFFFFWCCRGCLAAI